MRWEKKGKLPIIAFVDCHYDSKVVLKKEEENQIINNNH